MKMKKLPFTGPRSCSSPLRRFRMLVRLANFPMLLLSKMSSLLHNSSAGIHRLNNHSRAPGKLLHQTNRRQNALRLKLVPQSRGSPVAKSQVQRKTLFKSFLRSVSRIMNLSKLSLTLTSLWCTLILKLMTNLWDHLSAPASRHQL